MFLSGSSSKSLSAQLSGQSLNGALATAEKYAMTSEAHLEEVLDLLVNSATHARVLKGMKARLADESGFTATNFGHAYAQYATFVLFEKLLKLYKKTNSDWLDVYSQCKKAGFDQPPKKGPDGGDGGGSRLTMHNKLGF